MECTESLYIGDDLSGIAPESGDSSFADSYAWSLQPDGGTDPLPSAILEVSSMGSQKDISILPVQEFVTVCDPSLMRDITANMAMNTLLGNIRSCHACVQSISRSCQTFQDPASSTLPQTTFYMTPRSKKTCSRIFRGLMTPYSRSRPRLHSMHKCS